MGEKVGEGVIRVGGESGGVRTADGGVAIGGEGRSD